MPTFIDVHQHILPGLDDGARDMETARRMADEAAAQGVRVIIATPHVRPGIRAFDGAAYQAALDELNAYCARCGNGLHIVPGGEIKYTEATVRLLRDGYIPTLNGTRFILVEWSYTSTCAAIHDAVRELSNAGYKVVVAHAERYPALFRRGAVSALKDAFDVRVQVDCEAVLGRESFRARHFVSGLLKQGLVDYVATDAHGLHQRPICMAETYARLKERVGRDAAQALTGRNQMELLTDRL